MSIQKVSSLQASNIKKKMDKEKFFLAEMDGAEINTLTEYMKKIIEVFHFPDGMFKNLDSFDSYNDWMRDFTWLDDKNLVNKDNLGYALFLYNLDKMMANEPENKEAIIELFSDSIIPFWKEEVEHVVVGGRRKIFDVYLVD